MARWFVAPLLALVVQFAGVARAQDLSDSPVEYKLAVIQTGGYVSPDDMLVKRIGFALDDLQDRCTEPRIQLSDMAVVTHDALVLKGVGQSHLTILQHVNENAFYVILYGDPDGPDKIDCITVFATYVETGGAR